MRLISERRIKEFGDEHPDATAALGNWERAVRAVYWRNHVDVRAQFHDSDLAGERTVFNIAKNRYRLIAFIAFRSGIVYIKEILSHKEYDKGQWKPQ